MKPPPTTPKRRKKRENKSALLFSLSPDGFNAWMTCATENAPLTVCFRSPSESQHTPYQAVVRYDELHAYLIRVS